MTIIGGEGVEHLFVPGPVWQHLRGRLDEITRHMRPGEAAVPRASNNRMQAVAELVKQRFHILVRHEGWFVRARWREVAKQSDSRPLVFSVRYHFATDNFELGDVLIFSFAR